MGREDVSGSSRFLAAPGDTEGPARSLWCRKTSTRAKKPQPRVFRAGSVPLLGCLAPRPGGGAVGQASCPLRRRMRCPGRGRGRGGHVTPLPCPLVAKCFRPLWMVRGVAPTPRGLLPGMDNLGRPEAAEPEGRFESGGPPHFLRFPGGGAISARWAHKSRKLGSCGRTRCV